MTQINGGTLLARTLNRLGVSEVFTLHGGHLDAFLVACDDNDIRLTDTRHEATAGYAANGYARATGECGVCVITAGPGFTNAVTAMADGMMDAMPALFISGSSPLREAETNPLQGGFDQVAVARPVTKWAHRITNVERIPDLVEKAMRIATSGKPGPVYLEVPIDIMFGIVDDAAAPLPDIGEPARPAPSKQTVDAVIAALRQAKRPVLITGAGAIWHGCPAALAEFADLTGIPVLHSLKAKGILPDDHPAYVGEVAAIAANRMAGGDAPDLVIQLGARAGLLLGGRSGGMVPPDATLIQIDLDAAEIGRIRRVDHAITADSATAIAAFIEAARGLDWPGFGDWLASLKAAAEGGRNAFAAAPATTERGLIHPFHAAREIARALDPETAISLDGGEMVAWYHMVGRSPGPGLYSSNGYLGTLGIGQGHAIGFARARGASKPVAAIVGDGAIGFHIAEFDTFSRHGLPILLIVFNNAVWGMSQHGQQLVFGENANAATLLARSDYEQVAIGLGCDGRRIDRVEDIGPAVRAAQQSGLPTCLNILVDGDIAHPVTAMMVGDLDSEGTIPVPYYENIPV
jgi:acetolactate synthase I/II/III large subunit